MTNNRISRRYGVVLLAAIPQLAFAAPVQTLGPNNTLITVDTATPGTIQSTVTITGVAANTRLAGLDYRPATPRVLYAISNVGQIYVVNARTGVASAVGTPPLPTVSGIGFDFNPTVDRIRIITQVGQNVRANPDTGALAATDGTLAFAAGDPSFGQIPTASGAAYTNNVAGATTTTLYAIDTRGGLQPARLVTQGNATVSPNTGALFTVGSTGVITASSVGFDIGRDGTAYATLTNPATLVTSLYSVNLGTGAATLIGAIGGNTTYDGLAVALASFTSMGATANQNAVGGALDQFTGVPSANTLTLFNGIDGVFGTAGAQSAALQQLSPAAYSLIPEISLTSIETIESGVLHHSRLLRGGAVASDAAEVKEGSGVGIWLTGGSRLGNFGFANDRYSTSIGDVHVLGGIDYTMAPGVTLGAFGGYGTMKAQIAPGSIKSNLRSGYGGGFISATAGPAQIALWGSYTDLDWSFSRNVAFGSFAATPTGRTGGYIAAGGASLSVVVPLDHASIEPFAGYRYSKVKLRGFGEEGGSIAALTIGRLDRESVRSHVGVRGSGDIDVGGAIFTGQAHGGWSHEFRDQTQAITANFSTTGAGIDAPFTFVSTPLARDYYDFGGSLAIGGKRPLSFIASYDLQLARDRHISEFTIGARYAF